MPEPLSQEDVRHVAELARLDLTEDEVSAFTEQLSAVLVHADDIEALDIADVEPTTHALPLTNVLREDEIKPGLDRDLVLSQAPDSEAGQFRVPKILGEEQ